MFYLSHKGLWHRLKSLKAPAVFHQLSSVFLGSETMRTRIKITSSTGKDIDCRPHALEHIQITHTPRVHCILGELSTRCRACLSIHPVSAFVFPFLKHTHNYAVAAGESIKPNTAWKLMVNRRKIHIPIPPSGPIKYSAAKQLLRE